ncbi:MAG: Ig-like domain-containing protein [Bacteroides sp.]|nr:Ig-like domain-containing protein [Bacteroides sp.]
MITYSLHKSLGCLLLAAASLGMLSCTDDETVELSEAIYPGTININLPDAIKSLIYQDENGTDVLPLLKGESVSLGYTLLPENVTYNEVAWSSSNESVATVDEVGTVTAVAGNGENYSVIQVAPSVFYTGSGIYSTLKVIVSNELKKAESISITSGADQVYMGESLQLDFTILPGNTTYKTVKWTSSDESVATVDENGLVTGQSIEDEQKEVTITATALDGSQVSASKTITVLKVVQPQEVTIDQTYSAEQGYCWAIAEKTVKLQYTTTPANVLLH